MKMVAPPAHTPVSMRSPGMSSRITSSTHSLMLSSRFSPIIVWAKSGQSPPLARSCSAVSRNGTIPRRRKILYASR